MVGVRDVCEDWQLASVSTRSGPAGRCDDSGDQRPVGGCWSVGVAGVSLGAPGHKISKDVRQGLGVVPTGVSTRSLAPSLTAASLCEKRECSQLSLGTERAALLTEANLGVVRVQKTADAP